ncbi:DUF6864 domain-containing function [Pseudomonas sp. LW8]|jgi:hypothetical protein|uniref:DUF6864 domain-containing function n=1 Tax=Pseudomonas sp. LW8 TaxID=3242677 RepID=UPI0035C252DC
MDVTASIDGLTLIDSGTALLANSELKLEVESLPISISFKSDSGTTRWETQGSEATGVIFTLFNMDSPQGGGIFTPVSIAKSPEVEFFLSLYVTTLNKGAQRIVVYNLFAKGDDV